MSLLAFLPIKMANTFRTHQNYQVSDQLPDLQDRKSLMVCGRSFSQLGKEFVAIYFAYEGRLFVINECL